MASILLSYAVIPQMKAVLVLGSGLRRDKLDRGIQLKKRAPHALNHLSKTKPYAASLSC